MSLERCERVLLIGAIAFLVSGICLMAQDGRGTPPTAKGAGADAGSSRGESGRGNRPPKPPLELALDANQDGIIDADEIANAATALRKLDKNGDGKLTPDEYRPPRPPREDGRGPGGGSSNEGSGQGEPPSGEAKR